MKRTMLLLTGLAVVCLVLAPAMAAKGSGGDAKSGRTGKGGGERGGPMGMHQAITGDNYDTMVKELKLADDQAAKLKAKFDAKDAALAAWDKDNAEKLAAANAEMQKARDAKDRAAAQTAGAALGALTDEKNKLVLAEDAKIEASLTAEQRAKWIGYKLDAGVTKNLAGVSLTEEQTAKVRTGCDAAAKRLTSTDQAALDEAIKALTDQVKKEVLTDEQRAQLQQAPTGGAEGKHRGGGKGGTGKGGAATN